MRVEQLDYDLPAERIAAEPVEPRDAARLLVADRGHGTLSDRQVRDLPELGLFKPGDLLVLNRTRVLPAAFTATREATGGQVGGLFLSEPVPGQWQVLLESRGKLQPGERLTLGEQASLELQACDGGGQWRVTLDSDRPTEQVLSTYGTTPLPPYIRKARRAMQQAETRPEDAERYNTVFARETGSLAAPTAGRHFTAELLDRLRQQGVGLAELTLHVGMGTFTPIREAEVTAHHMHAEWIDVPAETIAALQATRQAGRRIVPIGTTSVRALESLPASLEQCQGGYTAETELFIHPEADFQFRFTDALLTNFHLPRSTLIAMVAALPGVGLERLKQWYQHAIEQQYRFYSYGDAMLIW
jgi:S-adenosylmethionine:tRNA ribosyltransferase-isomerase